MAIALLSESKNNTNKELRQAIIKLLPTEAKVAYIPSQPDPDKQAYKKYVSEFIGELGLHDITHFELEGDYWQDSFVNEVYKHNVLFLPGGNMYRFAYWLKQRRFADTISEFAKNRLIIGVSAGAIVLTPRVDIARDANDIGLTEFTGFSVVDFYFKPHYENTPEYIERLELYKSNLPKAEQQKKLYACPDNSGVIVHANGEIEEHGKVWVF